MKACVIDLRRHLRTSTVAVLLAGGLGSAAQLEAQLPHADGSDTLEAESGHVRVDGTRLFYRALGSGEPVIVLHGGPSPGHGYLLPWMERLGDRHRVVLFDQRGIGRSDGARDSASLTRAALVADVDGLRRALGLDGPFHLVGHSWGGLLAIEYALRHPEELRSLVLVATTEPGSLYREELASALTSRGTRADSIELARLFASPGFRRGDTAVIERIYRLTYTPWLGRPDFADRLSFPLDGEMARKGRRTARHVVANSPPPDHWGELAALRVPTLVVHGDRDPIPLAMARRMADSLPRAALRVLEGVGHFPFAEAPEAFFAALREFLEAPEDLSGSRAAAEEDSFIEVDGRQLRLKCEGAGEVGALFLHGARSRLETWRRVLRPASEVGRACAYDRPGHGESDAAPAVRRPLDLVSEVDAVAREARVDAPFVLVGHSLGGLYARLYAAMRPEEVGALVLVDPTHEEMHARVRGAVPEEFWRSWGESRLRNDDGLNELAVAELLRGGLPPDVPVWVITAGVRRGEEDGFDPVVLDRVTRELHAEILEGVREGYHWIAEGGGHDVQLERPALVVRAIRQAVESLR